MKLKTALNAAFVAVLGMSAASIFPIVLKATSIKNAASLDEDLLVLEALELAQKGDYAAAADAYLTLFYDTNRAEYIKEAALIAGIAANYDAAASFASQYLAHPAIKSRAKVLAEGVLAADDMAINHLLLDLYITSAQPKKARVLAEHLRKIDEPNALLYDYALVSVLLLEERPDAALTALLKLYKTNKNSEFAQKIAQLYILLKKPEAAMGFLESYLKEAPCEPQFCEFAAGVFSAYRDTARLENLMRTIYTRAPSVEAAKNLIAILAHQKKFDEAAKIAQNYPFDYDLQLALAGASGDFAAASKFAKLLYEKRKDAYFWALSLMYEFEAKSAELKGARLKKGAVTALASEMKKAMAEINAKRLEQAKDAKSERVSAELAHFANFYGYLLIDYDLDVSEGVRLVRLALSAEPDNEAYIDSLAWGLFKQGDCKAALAEFSRLNSTTEEEILSHIKTAKQTCGK